MKALFVSVLLLGLFTATLASRRDRSGHRRTQDTVYSLQRYVFSLKMCLRDVRAENNQLTATNNKLKEDNKELEVVKAENKELEEKVQKLEEDIEALEECCAHYGGNCYKENEQFVTDDGCFTCVCTSESMSCTYDSSCIG